MYLTLTSINRTEKYIILAHGGILEIICSNLAITKKRYKDEN